MPSRLVPSLSFQVSAAFLLLLVLFAAASLYSLGSFQRQLAYDSVVGMAGRLELTAQRLHMQAMNYEQNAPRDYTTYHRDVQLYYQDLKSHMDVFDKVMDFFMSGDFRGEIDGFLLWLRPSIGSGVTQAIHDTEQSWSKYRAGLVAALGPNPEEPRLEYAAEHNLANHGALEQSTQALTKSLRQWANLEHRKMMRVSLLLVLAGVLMTLLILAVLYLTTLAPLRRTVAGIRQVADGDFGHRIPVTGTAEVRQLTDNFNGLSARLDVLFKLIERLQHGNDLDEVIRFLSQEFPDLLRIDWIGVVLFSTDAATARLEVSYMDGQPELVSKQIINVKGTLLEKAVTGGVPFHIRRMSETAAANPNYQFLRHLVERGLQDTILLPLTPQTLTPIPAVVVFATRLPGSYDDAHLQFLDNIAQLITHSFGRTVRLAEHGRLAAIGEFASGIAHELRTPLATLTLAIDYFDRLGLEEKAAKRVKLARQESARMQRLLEEILLYAKPVNLDLRSMPVTTVMEQFIDNHQALAAPRRQKIVLEASGVEASVVADSDRLAQILVNLTENACEASPEGAEIRWIVREDREANAVTLEVQNPGDPIPPDVMDRLTEPFFSTKPSGTGLGLAIVRRLVIIQGGELSFLSRAEYGTSVQVRLPRHAPIEITSNSAPATTGIPN